MKYATIKHTGWKVSMIGLGCEHLENKPFEQVDRVVNAALDADINIMDIFMSEPNVRSNIGKALGSRRDKVMLQGHIGAVWGANQYNRSTDPARCEEGIADFLKRLNTDYVDIGMIHCIDTPQQTDAVLTDDYLNMVRRMKANGTIRAVGLSSHSAEASLRILETGLVDVLMFSVNPLFDMMDGGLDIESMMDGDDWGRAYKGENARRMELYRRCEETGVAITVMKAFGGGRLLKKELTPLDDPLTTGALIRYALDRPAVASVLVGCQTPEEVADAVAYFDKSDAECDYSILAKQSNHPRAGSCVYCNHCLPCPANIDIAAVMQAYDTVRTSTEPVQQNPVTAQYTAMEKRAGDCVACGACSTRCPFGVDVVAQMDGARTLLGC